MIRTVWQRGAALGAAGLLLAGAAAAQGTLDLTLLDQGKPLPGAPVSAVEVGDLLNMGKPVGTTDPNGKVSIPVSSTTFAVGSRVEIWIRSCRGQNQVVLVPEGAGSRCDDPQVPAQDRCSCRRLGAFTWGAGSLTVDVGTGAVSQTLTQGTRHTFYLGGGIKSFPNLEDAVMGQTGLTMADVGSVGANFHLGYEVQPAGLPLSFGVRGDFTRFGQFSQTYGSGSGLPTRNQLDFRVATAGLQLGLRPWPTRFQGVTFFGSFDALMAFNSLDLETFYPGQTDPVTGNRSESGLRLGTTLGADLNLGSSFGLRLQAGYEWGKGNDADTNFRAGLGLTYTPKSWLIAGPR